MSCPNKFSMKRARNKAKIGSGHEEASTLVVFMREKHLEKPTYTKLPKPNDARRNPKLR